MKKNNKKLKSEKIKKRCFIVGAGVAGKELLEHLISQSTHSYEVLGFIDDNKLIKGKKIKNILVIGNTKQLEKLIEINQVDTVFIAIPSAKGSLIRLIVNSCQRAKVSFRIVPRTLDIVQGKVNFESVRPISVEDILGRAIVKTEQKTLKSLFTNKRVLITGAAGSIGSELAKQVALFKPKNLMLFDWWENGLFELDQDFNRNKILGKRELIIGNIQDKKKVDWVFKNFRPQLVFHAAAFKHVPLMEAHPEEATKNNILGTQICAEHAGKYQVERFTFISTDKAVNPSSVMGATKSYAELLIRYFNKKFPTKFTAVRFGNVLGSHGSVVPLFQKQIALGGPVTVTHPEMVRFFMTIPEAVQLILQASKLGKGGEIFVLDMGEQVKIMELAKTMIRLSGYEPDRDIAIKIIGKRPGEKIYEELLTKEEKMKRTQNKLIFITKNVIKVKDADLLKSVDELINLVNDHNRNGIITELKRVLPTYKSI